MAFQKNDSRQMSIFDSACNLTHREKKALDRSWTKIFAEDIYNRDTETDNRIKALLEDADKLPDKCNGSFEDITEFQLFIRCISEQTIVEDGIHRLVTKEDNVMNSDIMQNPSDPDVAYREKAGKKHRGYSVNIEESVGENGSVVTDYQFDKNNKSDSAFLKEHLADMEHQDERTTIVADGAYASEENRKMADDKNIDLVTTDLPGADVDPIKGEFDLNDEGTAVIRCPAGYTPKSNWYNKRTGQILVSFDYSCCANCPHKAECRAKIYKKVCKVSISPKMMNRAKLQSEMQTEEFKNLARLRNGEETIPSVLKNVYDVNRMHVRGLIRCKFCFGGKIAALNFQKLLRFRRGTGNYAQNPVLIPSIS